jgi:hypothetical protein
VAQRAFNPNEEDYPLREEEEFFEEHRAEWLRDHEGELALVKGRKLYGFYASLEEAFQAGLREIGYQDMLIKDVLKEDPVSFLYR